MKTAVCIFMKRHKNIPWPIVFPGCDINGRILISIIFSQTKTMVLVIRPSDSLLRLPNESEEGELGC